MVLSTTGRARTAMLTAVRLLLLRSFGSGRSFPSGFCRGGMRSPNPKNSKINQIKSSYDLEKSTKIFKRKHRTRQNAPIMFLYLINRLPIFRGGHFKIRLKFECKRQIKAKSPACEMAKFREFRRRGRSHFANCIDLTPIQHIVP